MHKGTVKRIVRDRGFGFINAVDGREIFMHRSSMMSGDFDALREGQALEFEVEKSPKGPRAINVNIIAQENLFV